MIIPTKHENLNTNLMVLGSKVLQLLNSGPLTVEDIIQDMKKSEGIREEKVFEILTFLFATELINIHGNLVRLLK